MKYRVEAEFRYKGYIEVEAPNEDAAWDIAENTDGGEFEEMPETSGWEIEKPKLIGIETKEIDVADFGVRSVAKESDQDAAYDYLEQSRFDGVKEKLKEMVDDHWEIPKMVACIYDLFQEYIISETQEQILYAIADPFEDFNECSKYWHEMDYKNPLMEALH